MSLIRAGGLTTLILALLTTAALVAFGGWYTNSSIGENVGHIMLWLPISLFVSAPVGLIVFPVLYTLIGVAGRPSPKLFAVVGGAIGAAVAGYALFRFRGNLAVNPSIMFLAMPLLIVIATILGIIGGFVFERLARHSTPVIPPLRAHGGHGLEEPLPPPHPGDLKPPPGASAQR